MGDCQRSAGLFAGETPLRRRQHPLPPAGRLGAQLRRDGRLRRPQIDGPALHYFRPSAIIEINRNETLSPFSFFVLRIDRDRFIRFIVQYL